MRRTFGDLDVEPDDDTRDTRDTRDDPAPIDAPAPGGEAAGAAAVRAGERTAPHRGNRRNRRARQRRYRRRRWLEIIGSEHRWRDQRHLRHERWSRVRVLTASVVGVTCLLLAHWLQPDQSSLFAMPTSAVGWASLLCGIIGVWLVPGVWLCALIIRTGAGLAAWLGARIATTVSWYALVGPIIHQQGQGAQVTTGGILIATTSATVAVCLGVLLGMSRRPAQRWARLLLPAIIGAICTQVVISVWMRVWTYDMNYSHIRRLDWLIVLACALLVTVGALSRPAMPPVRTVYTIRIAVASIAVVVVTAAALSVADDNWSPAQRMPSAFSIEQIPAPAGADVAFSLTAIGPDGPQLIERAEFTASDEAGRAVPVHTQVLAGATGEQATLLVTLQQGTQPVLCRPGRPAKLTVRDTASGVRMQAVVADGWCPE